MRPSRSLRPVRVAFASALVAGLGLCGPVAAQVVQSQILPPDPFLTDLLVAEVEWTAGEAFLSALGEDTGVVNSGGIYVYGEVGNGWQFRQLLKAPELVTNASFGHTLEVSGEWLLTTEPWNLGAGPASGGAAHVFRRVDGTWVHHQLLVPQDAAAPGMQLFGLSADIDASTLVVGCWADTSLGTAGGGSAYVFELAGQTWSETAKLVPAGADLQPDALFGYSVAVRDEVVVVGAIDHGDGGPGSNHGAAFVFERVGGAWEQTQKLLADDGHAFASFGNALALQGDTLLVGSRSHDHSGGGQQNGAVYEFRRVGGAWIQNQELSAPQTGVPNEFGRDVDLDGDLAVVGSALDDDLGSQAGSAHLFRREGLSWQPFGKALAPDGSTGDHMADDVRIRGTRILLGAQGWEDTETDPNAHDNGAAYVFELAPDAAQYGSCFALGPCGNGDDHGGCANSDGQGAVLAAGGSTSVAQDELALEARWLPPHVLGILFIGGGQQAAPFGDGLLSVGPGASGVYRILPPKSSGAQGAMLWHGGLVALSQSHPPAGQIEAGDTWYAQVWYRDPSGPCGSGFNTSNGLEIEFVP